MKLDLTIIMLVVFSLVSCKTELDSSMTENLIGKNNFKVKVASYGGFAGKGETTYYFKQKSDSVRVKITHHGISPKEKFKVNISKSNFEEIKNQLICLSKLESDIGSKYAPQLFDSDYLISSGLKTIFIYPKKQDTCRFWMELPEYEPEIDLLN